MLVLGLVWYVSGSLPPSGGGDRPATLVIREERKILLKRRRSRLEIGSSAFLAQGALAPAFRKNDGGEGKASPAPLLFNPHISVASSHNIPERNSVLPVVCFSHLLSSYPRSSLSSPPLSRLQILGFAGGGRAGRQD